MTTEARPTFFFMHVMKTGGQSFLRYIRDNFAPGELEPDVHDGSLEGRRPYGSIERIRAISPERRRELRVIAGHVPYCAIDLIHPDVTITVLRDPVDRSLSMLRQWKRDRPEHADRSLEEIYHEDPIVVPLLIQDHQTKQFSLSWADDLSDIASLDVIDVDQGRLETAKANLDRVDVIGLHHRFEDFHDELRRRYGWEVRRDYRLRVSTEDWPVSDAFRRELARDNEIDVELFRYATERVARQ